ncbi:MAG: tRNA (adenosine(37)-N6)-dimethylallyltransferase MiaA [Ferruginibacter sp.]
MNKTCIIITGPTAVGKTALAIEVAQHFSTKIISADSRQCYKELNIAVAKPSSEELKRIHHFFIDTLSVQEDFSAADFETYALQAVNEIFTENDIAVMVGGTGLYIKAFCEGLDEIPAVDETIRKTIIKNYEEHGLTFLQAAIKKADPAFYEMGEIQNPHRMIRALEVQLSTGRSITTFQSKQKKQRDFNIIKIGLELPREILYQRINERVDKMIDAGLVAEAKDLIAYKKLNALQTVGYRELFDYFDNKINLEKAIELIKQNTRHYAKRQMTWFKKDEGVTWCSPVIEEILRIINVIGCSFLHML